jgi:hypothetical protein
MAHDLPWPRLDRAVGHAEESTPQAHGKEEMHELVRATFMALEEAELSEFVHQLRDRVFVREADELLETNIESGICRWRFKPMVELMLRHVLHLATTREISPYERRLEIEATIEAAGF